MSTTAPDERITTYTPVVPTTDFPVLFPVFASNDLSVYVNGEERSDFTITAAYDQGVSTNAKVIMNAGVTGKVIIAGERAPRRQNRFGAGPIPTRDLNLAFDTIEVEMQEARRDIGRALLVNYGEAPPDISDLQQDIEDAVAAAAAAVAAANGQYRFETVADLGAATVPSVIHFVEVAGFYSAGDGGGSYYVRLPLAPNAPKPWHLQTADAAWWEMVAGHVDARMFGLKADGSTGAAAAIRAAISFVVERKRGTISFPAGTIVIDEKIVIPSRVSLIGSGMDATVFKAKDGLNDHMFTTSATDELWGTNSPAGASYWGIRGCTLDGNKAHQTAVVHGIHTYSRCYRLDDLKIINMKGKGVSSQWFTGAAWDDPAGEQYDLFMESRWTNVFVSYCDREGIDFDGPHDSQWSNVLVGLCSHSSPGSYSGVVIGPNAGGHMAVNCHSWGDTHKYAFHVKAGWTHFGNCEADDAYTALVLVEGDQFSWMGGVSFGAAFGTPTAQDLNLKGFLLGSPSRSIQNPRIECTVLDCPKGVVSFDNIGPGGGIIKINGQITYPSLVPGSVGFSGSIPGAYDIALAVPQVESAHTIHQLPYPGMWVRPGSESFPSLSAQTAQNSGLFWPSGSTMGLVAAGSEALRILGDRAVKFVGRSGPPSSISWEAGMVYFDTSTNKLRCFNGSAWMDLF